MGLAILVAILLVGATAFAAYHGRGYRGLYIALAIFGLLAGAGCVELSPSDRDVAVAIASGDQGQIAGSRFLQDYSLPIALCWFGLGLGGVFGAALYRPPRR